MKVLEVDSIGAEYDAIVNNSPRSTFYHTRRWLTALEQAYPRMTFRCLVAMDGNAMAGVMPYFKIARGVFRSVWSLPFATYGGPVSISSDADAILLDAFSSVARRFGVIETGWVDFANDINVDGEKPPLLT